MVRKNSFLINGIKHFNQIGTIFQCSPAVGKEIVKNIDFKNAKEIIELGAGEGAITKQILKKMRKNQEIICFEINSEFCEKLNEINDNRIKVINDSAFNIDKYLKKKQKYIISSLPLKLFSLKYRKKLLNIIKNKLLNDGKFIQFQYSLFDKKLIKKYFKKVKIKFVALNVLPGFIYICRNK